MFCTNCGKQIPDDSVFCVHCGARVSEEEPVLQQTEVPVQAAEAVPPQQTHEEQPVVREKPVKPPKPAKPKKPVKAGPIVAISLGVVIVIVAAVLGYFMFLSPSAKLKQNLENGDMEAAYEIYRENFQGEDLTDENVAYLEAGADQAEADYMAGTISYEAAMTKLDTLRGFNMINRKLDNSAESILKHEAEAVEKAATEGTIDYNVAVEALDKLTAYQIEDVNKKVEQIKLNVMTYAADQIQARYQKSEISYDEALTELNKLGAYEIEGISDVIYEATANMAAKYAVEQTMDSAKAAMDSGDYTGAMALFENVLSQDPSNSYAANGLQEAKNAYRTTIMTAYDDAMAQNDFNYASAVLKDGMAVLGEDAGLTEAMKNIESTEIALAVAAANEAAAGGDYDGALETLAAMQEKYPSDQQLMDTATVIINQRPVGMQDLEVTDALDIWYKDETIRDFFDNTYKGGMFLTYGDFQNTYAVYNLDGKYTRFTGTIIVSTDTRPDRKITYWIYLDDELVQTRDNITIHTEPMTFDIELTGAKTMKIVMKASGYIDTELYFVNTKVYKAAQ